MKPSIKKTLAIGLVLGLVSLTTPAFATDPVPSVNYQFEGNTTDSGNGSTLTLASSCPADPCNATTSFGSANNDGYLEWTSSNNRGGGFTIDTNTSLTNTYTVLMKFSFTNFSGYRKIIDYLNRTSDTGFYIHNSKINFYPLGTSTNSFTAGQDLTLMVTRQATNGNSGTFTVYTYDGASFSQQLQVTDNSGSSIPFVSTLHSGGTKLGFFFDDTATSSEATTSGRVYSIKMWDGIALDATQLEAAATAPASAPTPTPNDSESLANTGRDTNSLTAFALLAIACGVAIFRFTSKKA